MRFWRWAIVFGIIVSGIGAIATQVKVPLVDKVIEPKVECQQSPACRMYFDEKINEAINRLERRLRRIFGKEVVPSNPPPGGGLPGPPPGGSPGPIDRIRGTVCDLTNDRPGLICPKGD